MSTKDVDMAPALYFWLSRIKRTTPTAIPTAPVTAIIVHTMNKRASPSSSPEFARRLAVYEQPMLDPQTWHR